MTRVFRQVALASSIWLVLAKATGASTADDHSHKYADASSSLDPWDIYHPLDEGLWGVQDRKTAGNPTAAKARERLLEGEDVTIDGRLEGLRNNLRLAEIDSLRLFSKPPLSHNNGGVMEPMSYSIFSRGESSLKSIDPMDQHLVQPDRLFGLAYNHEAANAAHYRVCAALLLLRGYSDAAHEVLLGVTPANIKEAEYAATHRGQTDWAKQHPLTDSADMLHAAMHRLVEGNDLGEGNQSGYENAKYWYAGGPKLLQTLTPHPVRQALTRIAKEHTPRCVAEGNVVVAGTKGAKHTVLSGGGRARTILVPCGEWDPFAFLELCRQWDAGEFDNDRDLCDELATLQRAEIILLLRHFLWQCLGGRGETSSASQRQE